MWQKTKRRRGLKKQWVKAGWGCDSENGLLTSSFHQSRNKNWVQFVFFFDLRRPTETKNITHVTSDSREKVTQDQRKALQRRDPSTVTTASGKGPRGVSAGNYYYCFHKKSKGGGCGNSARKSPYFVWMEMDVQCMTNILRYWVTGGKNHFFKAEETNNSIWQMIPEGSRMVL